jgi:hypothetical protein
VSLSILKEPVETVGTLSSSDSQDIINVKEIIKIKKLLKRFIDLSVKLI